MVVNLTFHENPLGNSVEEFMERMDPLGKKLLKQRPITRATRKKAVTGRSHVGVICPERGSKEALQEKIRSDKELSIRVLWGVPNDTYVQHRGIPTQGGDIIPGENNFPPKERGEEIAGVFKVAPNSDNSVDK